MINIEFTSMTKKRGKSQHLFTSSENDTHRLLIMLGIVIFLFFILCSAYAIMMVPSNPAAWSMAAFFVLGFMMLVGFEENVFPDIDRHKLPHTIVTWFFAWIFVAFLVSFLITMNFAHMGMAVLFGVVVFLGSIYVAASEKGWNNFKTKTKVNTSGKIKAKLHIKSKKKKPKKTKKKRIAGW